MRLLTRFLIIGAITWLGVILFMEGHKAYNPENSIPQQGQAIMYFGGVVVVALAIGAFIALSVIPAFGDWVGHFLYNPNDQVERDPHMAAQAKIAQGDYEGAAEEYKRIYEENPSDTLAISEVARIYCEKLENPAAAAESLEHALDSELAPAEAAFLTSRLVDVYWTYQNDAIRSRQLLVQITEMMPDSKFSANAMHRLHEIDRALAEQDTAGFGPVA